MRRLGGSFKARHPNVRLLILLAVAAGLLAAPPAPAQTELVLDSEEDLDFDRPESWAMKFASGLVRPASFGVPEDRRPGSLELAVEAASVPSLSEDERRVGFNGTKVEDINRTDVIGQVRLAVGLPAKLTLTAALVPPVDIDGLEASLVSLGLERPLGSTGPWRWGLRLHAQTGTIDGDITCPDSEVRAGQDPIANPFGCLEPSEDEMELRAVGLALTAAFGRGGGWEPYLELGARHLDLEFQVDARYSGFTPFVIVDRTHQTTDGLTYSLAAGLRGPLSPRLNLAGEVFYSPLDVVRPPSTSTENDALVNVRALLSYRLR